MTVLERSPQDLSEAILTPLAPSEEIFKFRHTLLVQYVPKDSHTLLPLPLSNVCDGCMRKYTYDYKSKLKYLFILGFIILFKEFYLLGCFLKPGGSREALFITFVDGVWVVVDWGTSYLRFYLS